MKEAVLREFMKPDCLVVADACRRVGVHPSLAYYWAQTDSAWADELSRAKQVVGDTMVAEVIRRAGVGAKKVKEGSDLLLMFLTKAYKPEFREKPLPTTVPIDTAMVARKGIILFEEYLSLGRSEGAAAPVMLPPYLPTEIDDEGGSC